MRILVDADSCPRQAREMVLRFSSRLKLQVIFAANRLIPGTDGELATMELCSTADGSADDRLVELAHDDDIVLTRDLPLAERLVQAGVTVLDDRGRVFTAENIHELRSIRDFIVGLAETGQEKERIASYGKKELNHLANSLDRELTRLMKKKTVSVQTWKV